MVTASERAVEKLREQLLHKVLEANIGFRILITNDEYGVATFSIKIDRQRKGDEVIRAGGVKLFLDRPSAARIGDYQLDYQDGLNDGFFLNMPQEKQDD